MNIYKVTFEWEQDIEDYYLVCRVITEEYDPAIGTDCLEGSIEDSIEDLLRNREFQGLKDKYPKTWDLLVEEYERWCSEREDS